VKGVRTRLATTWSSRSRFHFTQKTMKRTKTETCDDSHDDSVRNLRSPTNNVANVYTRLKRSRYKGCRDRLLFITSSPRPKHR